MRHAIRIFLSLAICALGPALGARADDAKTAYIVAYFETTPAAKDDAVRLLRALAAASRKDDGNLRFEPLQRIGEPHHFAILEAWRDAPAQAAHGAAAHTREFREHLQPLLRSPYDERPHTALATGAQPAAALRAAIYAVTHVDIIPTEKEKGLALVRQLAATSRKDAGNLRFDAWQQASRPNHMTVVETWQNENALDAHGAAAHTRQFRESLMPLSGSLYDERLFKAID